MGSSPPRLEKVSESEDRAVEAHKSVNHPGFKTPGRYHQKFKTAVPVAHKKDLNVFQILKYKKPTPMNIPHSTTPPPATLPKNRNRMVNMQFVPNPNWRWRKQLMPDRIVYVYIVTRLRLSFSPYVLLLSAAWCMTKFTIDCIPSFLSSNLV